MRAASPRDPTLALPGTEEKIVVMTNRASLGLPIFMVGDIDFRDWYDKRQERRGIEPDHRRNGLTLVGRQVWMQDTMISVTEAVHNQEVGELLRRLRRENGISLEDLAKKILSHYHMVWRIENGVRDADITTFVNIAEALNFTVTLNAR